MNNLNSVATMGHDGQSTIAIEDIRTNVYVKHRNAIILTLVKALMDRSEKTRCQRKKFHVKTSLTKLRKTSTNTAAWVMKYQHIRKRYKNSKKTLETSRKKNEVLISENTNLEHEYDNAVKRNENANRYAESFKKQMLGQTEEMQAWNTVNKVLDNRKEGLGERNLALQKQNEGLIEQNQFLDGEHAEVWNDNELAHQQLSAGREKYAELLEKHQYLLDEYEDLCKEHSDVIKEAKNYEEFIDKYFENINGEEDD
ncbi:hypothetical protein UCRNP2_7133 [Neofusicoccum parvum UCRNP2]|uniref:Uncharacterized protein n=1 Tax=Botryosphaeria parva (strain UCR-NP2) TaxID=1287680 RepID=R1GD26_BOTPV|nr:hypothetical protein UCRNP2_7133 [Neofusicoccum parvum UCRNP2]